MKCPHCNEELKVPERAFRNADTYSRSVRVATECCYKLVRLTPQRAWSVSTEVIDADEDDWGVLYKK